MKGDTLLRHLVERAQEKDAEAFVQLMELHKEGMYKVARAYLKNDADTADAMQETVLKCFEKIHTLINPRFFKTWMIRILINNCKDILQKEKNLFLLSEEQELVAKEPAEDLTGFLQLLEQIDGKYRVVIILYYVEGYKIKEIASLLELNENTVTSQLSRARQILKKELEKERSGVWE